MPAPNSPPTNAILQQILLAIQNLQASVTAQGDDIDKLANYARYDAESTYGLNPDIEAIWDGSDRYL